MVAHGQDVGEHLGRVPAVGQPVPHRHPGVLAEGLDGLLGEPAELDAVEHAAEHPRGVLHRLLVPSWDSSGPEVGDVRALVVRGDLEGRTGPGRGLLEPDDKLEPISWEEFFQTFEDRELAFLHQDEQE